MIQTLGLTGYWAGCAGVALTAWAATRLITEPSGPARSAPLVSLVWGLGATGLGFVLSQQAESGWNAPIAWPILPFSAWAALASGLASLVLVGRFLGMADRSARLRALRQAASLAGIAAASSLWFRLSGDPVSLASGAIPLSMTGGLGLLALLACSGLVMALVVLVPRVQATVPYRNPEVPLFRVQTEGATVIAHLVERSGGNLRLEIERPGSMHGTLIDVKTSAADEIDRQIPVVRARLDGSEVTGAVVEEMKDGNRRVRVLSPDARRGEEFVASPAVLDPVRRIGLRTENYPLALEELPAETGFGLLYLRNTALLVILNVVGTLLSSALVAYAFSRMRFPYKRPLFIVLLSTMMLPAAVTLMPSFLIYRWLGWVDTLYPLWVSAFFGSAFNVFLLRQFFLSVPRELEEAAKLDGCSYLRTFWRVMLPQVKAALAVIGIWTFMGTWNNFMGPLIYVSSPENMTVAYATQLFAGDKVAEPGLLMAFATMAMAPVLAVFFFAQRYFLEGVAITGLSAR
ncbi:MAG: carbohydrate ABC transporter permease [Fimbriimonas ginsengisoli]|uniref:Carbohydrate ABC transporter permease n=1 Tax=Fimbriimonas ginsengisoli TaxID=1005039 RepID=A0A931PSS0_FIMGI|nr:carbohydrate ABC transporter permease [Fimbriimonas ginsengisoli]